MDRSVWRILDVNCNRASEGLRTIEDAARVIRENATVAADLKALRHDLAAIAAGLDRVERLTARDTLNDAGTKVTVGLERQRSDWRGIVIAAAERCQQSLRCLEEFSKLVSEEISVQFKSLRYRAYDVLASAELQLLGAGFPNGAQLYLLIDCSLPLARFTSYLRELAESGCDLFQLRDKDCDGDQLVIYARAALTALEGTAARLIINDRLDVALASGAAGVHLGQEDLRLPDARRIVGHSLWIGVSTHSVQQAQQAQDEGADYIGCGPTFPSATKSFDHFPGIELVAQIASQISIPCFAIGGIGPTNLAAVMQAGGSRVAVSSAVHASSDPRAVVAQLKRQLQAA